MIFILVVTVLLIMLTVGVHYQALYSISIFLERIKTAGRYKVMLGVLLALIAHFIEIWIFGITYYLIGNYHESPDQLVHVDGQLITDFFSCIYFSFASYSSLGFGDIVPEGPIRFMAGIEAVIGLVFIAWTASLLYIEMQKHWIKPHSN
ncbi:potassium channel family protein [Kangiella koreensis]|uniref:Ion transport 2 domain protein n=1 Tax=Kangiella koreensis (strain DSM 16069 / JCM 12317 / KCTC 12182 / SW-125) TaxID=523791 RepID=C7RD30_KANKD|nr:potassium channel family protein [Kangiella koreensis]ACV27172.1 Ion transport 2 domain protein [Kangiella koreensis DSM 16069]